MRRLVRFTAGFAVACAVSALLLWQKNLLLPAIYALLCGLLCGALQRKNSLFSGATVLLLGLAAGFGWFALYRNVYVAPLEALDGQTLRLRVTTTDFSQRTDYGYSVDGVTFLEGKPYFLRLYQKENKMLEPGTVLEADCKLRLTTPAGQKDSSYYRGNGLLAIATQKTSGESGKSEASPVWFLPARARRAALDHLQSCFPPDTAPFAKALLLGDTSCLSYETDTALKISGIRHVAAVSGLHVSALFGAIYFFFRRRRVLTFLIAVPSLLFFAAVTGFSPSVTRAVLMSLLMALGLAVKAEYDGLTSLSFAALVMLLGNPFVIFSVSFQLSAASVAGILTLSPALYSRIVGAFPNAKPKSGKGRVLAWFAGAVSVTGGAQLFSVPISAYYFGSVSLIGVVSNLLLIWMIPFLFCGTAAVGLLAGNIPAVCRVLAKLLSWPIRWVLLAAKLLARIPFGAIYTQSKFVVVWLCFAYLLILVYALRRCRFRVAFALGCISLAATIGASVIVPRMDALRLNVLDVGEGQAILIQSKGRSYLVDCGGDSDAKVADQISQTLLSQGIFRLDGLLLTHYDRDHVNALQNLLTRIRVNQFYLPAAGSTGLPEAFTEANAPCITWVCSDLTLSLPAGSLTMLAPGNSETDNENSMCVLFASEDCVILITGDRSRTGERELLWNYQLPDVDILIAGHHGSKSSTSAALLQAVRPETVIISAGRGNRYGHPAPELLARLSEFGCTVYRTDIQGSVLVRR